MLPGVCKLALDSPSAAAAASELNSDECEPPPRPNCLASAGPSNRGVPPDRWALSLSQWVQFADECMATSAWSRIVAKKGYADLYDVNRSFVRPWTRRTGSSVSLLMNPDRPLQAQVMISHSWAGDIAQSREALLLWARHADLPSDLAVWFCLFSNYQPGDEPGDGGPTVAEQLDLDPFGRVIRCVQAEMGMVIVHTTTAEVYDRLWCVFEIDKALQVGAKTYGVTSKDFLRSIADMTKLEVDTAKARCSVAEDEAMIRAEVDGAGGFARLNSTIRQFRFSMTLCCAAKCGRLNACRSLLSANADPNRPDARGRTCLHRAAYVCDLPMVELLLEWEADCTARDVEGSCPAHLLPLLTNDDTSLRLFRALVPSYEVAAMTNAFGIQTFGRFRLWARVASQGGPYVAGMDFARELEDRWPMLLGEQSPTLGRSIGTGSRGAPQGGFQDYHVQGRQVRVYTWRAQHEVRGDVLALSFTFPWSLTRDALQPLAEILCTTCQVNFHVLECGAVSGAAQKPFEEFSAEVAELVEALPLQRPLFIIDDSTGAGALVPWKLRTEPAGIVLINPANFYSEDFIGSAQHTKQVQILEEVSRLCLNSDVAAVLPGFSDLVYADDAQELAAIREEVLPALTGASPEWWRTMARCMSWCGSAKAAAFQRLAPLRSAPALVVCGAQGPSAAGMESALRFRRRLLPGAEVVFVQNSKIWWKLEGARQVEAVARAVADFVQAALTSRKG